MILAILFTLTALYGANDRTVTGDNLDVRDGAGGDSVRITAPTSLVGWTLTLPINDGTATNQCLATDGAGVTSWIDVIKPGDAAGGDLTGTYPNPTVNGILTDELSKVSANDTTAGYLNGKLVAGSGVTLTEQNDGANETLEISASVTDTDELAKVSANDTTAGYLNGKLVAGTNITLVENNDGANETLTINSTGGSGLTIGDAITGGTANGVLYEDSSNQLANGANFTHSPTGLTRIQVGTGGGLDLDAAGSTTADVYVRLQNDDTNAVIFWDDSENEIVINPNVVNQRFEFGSGVFAINTPGGADSNLELLTTVNDYRIYSDTATGDLYFYDITNARNIIIYDQSANNIVMSQDVQLAGAGGGGFAVSSACVRRQNTTTFTAPDNYSVTVNCNSNEIATGCGHISSVSQNNQFDQTYHVDSDTCTSAGFSNRAGSQTNTVYAMCCPYQ